MAPAYRRLLLLRRISHPHLQPAAATHCLSPTAGGAAALVKPSSPSAAERVETPLSTFRPGFTSDGSFKYSWHFKLGSPVGALLIGQAAIFLGLSNGFAFAQEDSVSPAVTSEQAEVNATGLQRFEEGSVVLNEHTVKWRIFTDNGRDFFQKVLSVQGKKRGAKSLTEESIRILEIMALTYDAGLGESLGCIQRMKYLSTELIKSKRFAEAEIWRRKILHALELSKGWDSLLTTDAAEALSLTLQVLEKFKDSEELLERSLAAKKKVLPEGHFLDYRRNIKFSNVGQNKLNSTSATYGEKIAATAILLEALEVVGLIDIVAKHELTPGPDTRRFVTKIVKQDYLRCLSELIGTVEHHFPTHELQELLVEARQIIEELGGESK